MYVTQLTHEILIVIIVGVVNESPAVLLIEAAHFADAIGLGVDGAPALEARLPEALVEALAEAAPVYLRGELAAQP